MTPLEQVEILAAAPNLVLLDIKMSKVDGIEMPPAS
jgi:CheY-like chemotaxis protein